MVAFKKRKCLLGCPWDASISYHRLPCYSRRYVKWITFLIENGVSNISDQDDKKKNYQQLCSRHFEESCFQATKTGKIRLMYNAVPTIPISEPNQQTPSDSPLLTSESEHYEYEVLDCEPIDQSYCAAENVWISHDNFGTFGTEDGDESPSTESTEEISPQTTRPLRYLGDCTSEDFSNPENCRKMFDLATKTIQKKNKQIKTLQRSQRKLISQNSKLKNLLAAVRRDM